MKRPREEWQHLALLISILFLFVITPVVATETHGALLMNAIAASVLVAGSYALRERRALFLTAMILSAISVGATLFLLARPGYLSVIFSHTCVVVLIIFFCVAILGYVLRGTRITMDKIFAAICVYMLLGYAWTFAYALVDEFRPASFLALSSARPDNYVARVLQMRYFSFVTLTTVGYGDILPRSDAARTLAELEAVTGQIYLTVLVARLVGLHIVHAHSSSPSGE